MLFLKVAVFVLVLQLTRGMAIAQKANVTKVGSLYYLCLSVLYMFEVTHDMISLYMILWVMFFTSPQLGYGRINKYFWSIAKIFWKTF